MSAICKFANLRSATPRDEGDCCLDQPWCLQPDRGGGRERRSGTLTHRQQKCSIPPKCWVHWHSVWCGMYSPFLSIQLGAYLHSAIVTDLLQLPLFLWLMNLTRSLPEIVRKVGREQDRQWDFCYIVYKAVEVRLPSMSMFSRQWGRSLQAFPKESIYKRCIYIHHSSKKDSFICSCCEYWET